MIAYAYNFNIALQNHYVFPDLTMLVSITMNLLVEMLSSYK